jgi:hypothetical protein
MHLPVHSGQSQGPKLPLPEQLSQSQLLVPLQSAQPEPPQVPHPFLIIILLTLPPLLSLLPLQLQLQLWLHDPLHPQEEEHSVVQVQLDEEVVGQVEDVVGQLLELDNEDGQVVSTHLYLGHFFLQ